MTKDQIFIWKNHFVSNNSSSNVKHFGQQISVCFSCYNCLDWSNVVESTFFDVSSHQNDVRFCQIVQFDFEFFQFEFFISGKCWIWVECIYNTNVWSIIVSTNVWNIIIFINLIIDCFDRNTLIRNNLSSFWRWFVQFAIVAYEVPLTRNAIFVNTLWSTCLATHEQIFSIFVVAFSSTVWHAAMFGCTFTRARIMLQ